MAMDGGPRSHHIVLIPCLLVWISSTPIFEDKNPMFLWFLVSFLPPQKPSFAQPFCRSRILDIGKRMSRAAWHLVDGGVNAGHAAAVLWCYGVNHWDITYSTESARRDDEDLGQKFQHQRQTFVSNLTQKFIPYDLRFTFKKVYDIYLTQRNTLWCITLKKDVYNISDIAMVPSSHRKTHWTPREDLLWIWGYDPLTSCHAPPTTLVS